MKTFEDEFEPGQDNPEDRPRSAVKAIFSWFFVASIIAALVYGAYWLRTHASF